MNNQIKATNKWKKKNPLKLFAHQMVRYALDRKEIVRGKCFCGEAKTEAHHDDYSKPLKIRWLCKKHHEKHHVKVIHKVGVDTDTENAILKILKANHKKKILYKFMSKEETLVRVYPGVRRDQKKLIKDEAKKKKVGEGEMHRIIIDYYFSHNK